MKKATLLLTAAIAGVSILPMSAMALPVFQVYAVGGDNTPTPHPDAADEDTWFTSDNPFDFLVVSAFQGQTDQLSKIRLIVSVPKLESGTVSVTHASQTVTLLTSINANEDISATPDLQLAGVDALTNIAGNDAYGTKDFLPNQSGIDDNHHPFKSDVSKFLIFDLGYTPFGPTGLGFVHDYNADDGSTLLTGQVGREDEFTISYTGFTKVHLDVYGLEGKVDNKGEWSFSWDENPNSHDSTGTGDGGDPGPVIPLPSVASMGLVLFGGLFGRRRTRRKS